MARTFGSVITRQRRGKVRYGLRFRIDGQELRSWSIPTPTRLLPYSSRDMADGVLAEIRTYLTHGIDPLAAIAPYLSNSRAHGFGKFWEEWIEHQRTRAQVGEITHRHVDVIARYPHRGYFDPIWDVSVFALDSDHMDALKLHLLARVRPRTTQLALSAVHACLAHLAKRKGMPAPPVMPTVKVPRYTPMIPSLVEQHRLFDAIPWEIRGYWLARGLLGVRDEEAARALLSDYRRGPTEASDEWLIRAKGGRDRLLPVPVELARWVREHRPQLATGGTMLFINPVADNPERCWKPEPRRLVFHAAAETIGCAGRWKPNEALRHCFGTRTAERLLRTGASSNDAIRQVMAIMGHTSAVTSTRYVQLGADALRGALGEPQGNQADGVENHPVKQ